MGKEYNRTELKQKDREEIFIGTSYGHFEEGLDNYYLAFEIYYRNKQLEKENFIKNFLKDINECQSCPRQKTELSYYDGCFLYDNEFCKITELESSIGEIDNERIIFIKKNDKILAELKIKLDPSLERGPII